LVLGEGKILERNAEVDNGRWFKTGSRKYNYTRTDNGKRSGKIGKGYVSANRGTARKEVRSRAEKKLGQDLRIVVGGCPLKKREKLFQKKGTIYPHISGVNFRKKGYERGTSANGSTRADTRSTREQKGKKGTAGRKGKETNKYGNKKKHKRIMCYAWSQGLEEVGIARERPA